MSHPRGSGVSCARAAARCTSQLARAGRTRDPPLDAPRLVERRARAARARVVVVQARARPLGPLLLLVLLLLLLLLAEQRLPRADDRALHQRELEQRACARCVSRPDSAFARKRAQRKGHEAQRTSPTCAPAPYPTKLVLSASPPYALACSAVHSSAARTSPTARATPLPPAEGEGESEGTTTSAPRRARRRAMSGEGNRRERERRRYEGEGRRRTTGARAAASSSSSSSS